MGKCYIDSINDKFVLNGSNIAFNEFTKYANGKILTLEGVEIIDSTLLSRLAVSGGKLALDGILVNGLDLGNISANILPSADTMYNLGSTTKKYLRGYLGEVNTSTINLDSGSITYDGTNSLLKLGTDTIATREWVNSSAIPTLKTINGEVITGTGDITIVGGSGGQSYMDIQYVMLSSTLTSIDAVGTFVDYVTNSYDSTLDYSYKIDNKTILLKAGILYRIEGQVAGVMDDDTNMTVNYGFGVYSDVSGTTLIKSFPNAQEYTNYSSAGTFIRSFYANSYYKPDVDCYLKLKTVGIGVIDSTGVQIDLKNTITKYNTSPIITTGTNEMPSYSATETLTEKRWIDGKPIYRKVLTYTPAVVSTSYTIDTVLTSSNSQLVNSNIIVNDEEGQYDKTSSGNAYAYCGVGSVGVYFGTTSSGGVGKVHYIVLEYTKSTDTLSSPVVVPVAVNPVMGVTGSVIAFAGTTSPNGYLMCDGSLVSRANYATLFSVIGTTYGVGDGSTTFNIPDLRGEFIRGLDGGRGVDASRTIGSSQADSLKSHTHTWSFYDNDGGSVTGDGQEWDTEATTNTPNHLATFTTGATGSTETRPRNIAMNYIIKY